MNALHVSALLVFLLGLAHSILGERYIIARLIRRNRLPRLFGGTAFTAQTLRFAWHLTTVAWWGLATIVWLQAGAGDHSTGHVALRVVGMTLLVSGFLPLVLTRGRHLSWVVLFASGGLVVWSAL